MRGPAIRRPHRLPHRRHIPLRSGRRRWPYRSISAQPALDLIPDSGLAHGTPGPNLASEIQGPCRVPLWLGPRVGAIAPDTPGEATGAAGETSGRAPTPSALQPPAT